MQFADNTSPDQPAQMCRLIWACVVLLTESMDTVVHVIRECPGPNCSKLTTSLINNSLKFTLSDTQICRNFLLKK